MENETTDIVVPQNTHETLAQVAIKEVVKALIGLTVTTIGLTLMKRMSKRPGPIEVIVVEPPSTEEK